MFHNFSGAGRSDIVAKKNSTRPGQEATELRRDLLILQLGLANVPQDRIRKIAGCGMNRVNDMLKYIPKPNRKSREAI
jgi:hypothetical protein